MERSLRRGFLDLVVASLRPALDRRDLAGQITDVKTAFSSWDNCMQVTYCKWPVIAVIIIGGLIIFSVIWCIIRCACCGLSCCCSCFSCLKCCGNCCGCCDPPRGSRRKYLDEPYIPPHHGQGYKPQEPMHTGFGAATIPTASKGQDFPQYAEFDVGGKKNDDALPEMPSWEGAERKKVLLEEEEGVEMNALKKPEAGGQVAAAGAMGGAAAATAASPTGSRSPVNRSPYGPPGPGSGSNGYYGVAGNDPYAQGAPGFNQPGMAYNEPAQGYGVPGGAMGPRSPRAFDNGEYNDPYSNGGHGQGYDYPAGQGSYGNYGAAAHQQPYDNYDNYSSQANQGYGIARQHTPHEMDATPYGSNPPRSPGLQGPYGASYGPESRRSPAPQGQYGSSPYPPDSRRSPAPQGDYARRSPAPQAEYGNSISGYNNNSNWGYGSSRAPPQRQYSSNNNNNGISSPTPLRNEAGFDFTSGGYSRPPPAPASPVNGTGGYRQQSPSVENQAQRGGGYPGYRAYQQ
ncbi:hypothetical protein C8A03DRAFT_41593 [Achaetomium macrosporum]|uniref:Fibroin-3 related protein n=1 Tax=Achaetomium macrosporum TaxID=79813 RepID=A0AAN7HGE5_9PEZI|nr:hypothetical protein C8A03DRAFT_41593 [Achaetomium macrosporum]